MGIFVCNVIEKSKEVRLGNLSAPAGLPDACKSGGINNTYAEAADPAARQAWSRSTSYAAHKFEHLHALRMPPAAAESKDDDSQLPD